MGRRYKYVHNHIIKTEGGLGVEIELTVSSIEMSSKGYAIMVCGLQISWQYG